MANFLAIADIDKTIIELLRRNMVPDIITKDSMIDMCSPEESNVRLGIFLYSVLENRDNTIDISRRKRTSFDLYYLFTAYSSTDENKRIVDEHIIIGKVLEILGNTPVFTPALLQGSIQEEDMKIYLTYENLDPDDMTKVWNFSNIPYKCSVAFKVGPVHVGDPTASLKSTRVGEVI